MRDSNSNSMIYVKKNRLRTLEDLKKYVEDFVAGVPDDKLRRMIRNVRKRAALCVQEQWSHFEQLF